MGLRRCARSRGCDGHPRIGAGPRSHDSPTGDPARDAEEGGVVKGVHQVPEFSCRYPVLLLARHGAPGLPDERHGAVFANIDNERRTPPAAVGVLFVAQHDSAGAKGPRVTRADRDRRQGGDDGEETPAAHDCRYPGRQRPQTGAGASRLHRAVRHHPASLGCPPAQRASPQRDAKEVPLRRRLDVGVGGRIEAGNNARLFDDPASGNRERLLARLDARFRQIR